MSEFIIRSFSATEIAARFADWLADNGITSFACSFDVRGHRTRISVVDEVVEKIAPKISTSLHLVNNFNDPLRARLVMKITNEGEDVGELTILSGPIGDVRDYQDGKISMKELHKKWETKKT